MSTTNRLMLLLALWVSFCSVARGEPPVQPATRQSEKAGQRLTDENGDPLPAGATRRLGSVWFRAASTVPALSFTPDGKTHLLVTLLSAIRWQLRQLPSFHKSSL